MKYLMPSFKNTDSKALTSFIILIYMLLMFIVYPFYMKTGYVNIGEYKFYFFLYSSIGAVLLLLLTGLTELIKSFNSFTITDVFILGFIISSTISYLASDYRSISFLGADGWYLGFLFILIISIVYILISRLWNYESMMIYISLAVSAVVFLIGFLDRFSIYLIPLNERNPSFISTLGNINWFMGYYSVFVPLGAGLFLFETNKNDRKKYQLILLGLFVFIAFITGFAQGSESVFLVFFGIINVSIYLCYKKQITFNSVFLLGIIWAASGQIVRILRVFLKFNYDTDNLCGYFTGSNFTLMLLVILLSVNFVFSIKEIKYANKKVIITFYVLEIIGIIIWVILGVIKTNTELISGLNNSVFYFNEKFGNNRGEAYKVTFIAFNKMPLIKKIIGVGPDCYSEWVYSIKDLNYELRTLWPNDILVNAHNELLTMLINEGFLGVFCYFGIFISFIVNSLKKSSNHIILCISLSIICYLVHNMISFMQVLNTPYIFMLMAMGKSLDFFDKKHD